jgi:glycosyltransferase involved in cell wall biosynthesis
MRILIVTDAWKPQVNGVVRTLGALTDRLRNRGYSVSHITPDAFRTVPCPTYPEIRLALWPWRRVPQMIESFRPCAIHIATEGPLGLAARIYCVRRRIPFTTAYHTRFPEYVHARIRLPLGISYALVRWFHGRATAMMVATATIERDLQARGFLNIRRWTRGVDLDVFRPGRNDSLNLPRPVLAYVGRVAIEKNIEAFLGLKAAGTKLVVGDGPQMASLKARFPDAVFVGAKHGEELVACYQAADVLVFPSRTDTFGLVLIEALACGIPVAAYPVAGPLDVVGGTDAACLDEDLGRAVAGALKLSPEACRAVAERYSWDKSVDQFVHNLHPFDPKAAFQCADSEAEPVTGPVGP